MVFIKITNILNCKTYSHVLTLLYTIFITTINHHLLEASHLWIDILIEQSTECRVIKDVFSSIAAEGSVDVVQLREEGIGQCREEGDHPNQRNDLKEIFQSEILYGEYLDGPGESCHGVLVEGVADGEVAFH